ncbi:MAG: hypothetical protein CM1200mP29_13400 [Verrucomicrobiota bacterium]|nr:MAG: hypothetical protein CM1200mP29_13400 [Verrucomicrobiota bacterium]
MLWEVQGVGDYWLERPTPPSRTPMTRQRSISYKRDNWELFVYARNLADEGYSNNALDLRYTDFSNPGPPRARLV